MRGRRPRTRTAQSATWINTRDFRREFTNCLARDCLKLFVEKILERSELVQGCLRAPSANIEVHQSEVCGFSQWRCLYNSMYKLDRALKLPSFDQRLCEALQR